MGTRGPTTISGVLISAPSVLMDNDNDNHLFLHLSPESRILSRRAEMTKEFNEWQGIMKPFLTRWGLYNVSSSQRENSNIKICIIGSNCLMQTTQKISEHIKTNELFEQLQSSCDNPLINGDLSLPTFFPAFSSDSVLNPRNSVEDSRINVSDLLLLMSNDYLLFQHSLWVCDTR